MKWDCAASMDAPAGMKRKHSELDDGCDIVPQYDEIQLKQEITSLLQEQPNISLIDLVIKFDKNPLTNHPASSAQELSTRFKSTGTEIKDLAVNLVAFYTEEIKKTFAP